jgi:hypothetical protein
MSSSKEIDLYREFTAGVYLPEAQNPIPAPPPLRTVYVFTVYLFTQRKGWAVEPERRGEGGATVHKAGSKIPTGLTVSPVYKL